MKDKIKQNHKITIFAILLSVISIGVLVIGFLVVSSDKVVMLQSISNLYNKINDNFQDDFTLIDKIASSDKIGIEGDILVNNTNTITYNYLENKNNKKSSLDLKIEDKEKTLLDSSFTLDKNKIYLYANDITPNYYYTDFNYNHFIRSLTGNDYEDLVKLIKEAFDDNISNKSIKKEKTTIKYNGKDKKVNKLTYTFTNEKLIKVLNTFTKSLKNNKNLYKDIRNFFDINKKDFNKIIDNYRKELEKEKSKEIFSYSTYYYGFNRIVMYDLYFFNTKTLISYKEEDNKDTIKVDVDNNNVFNLVSTKDNDKYTFEGDTTLIELPEKVEDSLDVQDLDKVEFKGTYKNGKLDIKINDTYRIVYKKSSVDNNSFKYNIDIKVYNISNEKENKLFTAKMSLNYYFDTDVKKIEVESKDLNEIDEEEKTTLEDNIKNNEIYKFIFGNDIED